MSVFALVFDLVFISVMAGFLIGMGINLADKEDDE